MSNIIDRDKALELLARAVEANGEEYVYEDRRWNPAIDIEDCSYVASGDPTQPGCIVGHVVNYFSPEAFARLAKWEEEMFSSAPNAGTSAHEIPESVVEMTSSARDLLANVQAMQDQFKPWGDALYEATRR